MDLIWLETAGGLSVYLLLVMVIGALTLMAARWLLLTRRPRRAAGMSLPPPSLSFDGDHELNKGHGRLTRFWIEYVGNVSLHEETAGQRLSGFPERRRNQQVRAIMDRIASELGRHQVAPREAEALMEELRRNVRAEEQIAEARERGIRAKEQQLEQERTGLAERLSALLGDLPPDLAARIQAGLMGTRPPVDGAEEQD